MGRKSAAQLRRLEKRAAERGGKYVYSIPANQTIDVSEGNDNTVKKSESTDCNITNEKTNQKLMTIALRLQKELLNIEADSNLTSKDRRAAKRKAEAIAAEDSGMSSKGLMKWLDQNDSNPPAKPTHDANSSIQFNAAKKLLTEIQRINDNDDLKAKDRRSAKRKAEAISCEETGMTAEELLDWYEKNKIIDREKKVKTEGSRRRSDPLIAFVGQLSYETSTDDLMEHICSNLSDDYPKTKISQMTKIRLLTDPKTKKSRGMAFVEVTDPDFLYALLKLHQTYLKGRRINVEKSAGGNKHSEARKSKLDHYRKEQSAYFAEVVENILSEYKKTGELREDELDEGVVTVCKRHAGPVVRAAVSEYIEKGGKDMNNPSAYLTFLVTKFAKEGIHDVEDTGKSKKNQKSNGKRNESSGFTEGGVRKRIKQVNATSEFEKSGVDMSLSLHGNDSLKPEKGDKNSLSRIFPSSQRGRGRGYMRNVRR
mmetsp:Transcript_4991/g.12829  ORF Transcript_4991/g.12829 Transcript_4991/m.12829 type:complete len:482 (-) Transcript_4991:47-1492(-)|eukprot:CAMPEP_0197192514 /NCGR_PEP_ID=MMETSP1423-20130617/25191_1 /TAXON_ID=476441 /ORGANISM="Pseudo-nitzschia heimii, Strain UNC1101" /LENGTH=481 /DNA_ID=CAMNT_0042645411 /DNA_START=208 /DNA_END=1653 /DNA_ORIENTATION=+